MILSPFWSNKLTLGREGSPYTGYRLLEGLIYLYLDDNGSVPAWSEFIDDIDDLIRDGMKYGVLF